MQFTKEENATHLSRTMQLTCPKINAAHLSTTNAANLHNKYIAIHYKSRISLNTLVKKDLKKRKQAVDKK